MTTSEVPLAIAVLCVTWAVPSAVLITRTLDRRGLNTPLPLIGLFLFRNLRRYREITRRETGKAGLLFYSFVIPINAALALALIALSFRGSGA